jgi:hypothetical protein
VSKARAEGGDTAPPADDDLVDVRIGSGSDHTVFLNHLGVPTVGLSFDGPYGVYHSMYDGFLWMNRFGDPGYRYHVLLSRIWGTLALRLANADVLPFDFASYARHLRRFVALDRATEKDRLDLARLRAGVDTFEATGRKLNDALARALASGVPAPDLARRVNRGILDVERNWLDPDGLPGRPWFKHTLYAARYTYAHLELPGLTEAAEEKDGSLPASGDSRARGRAKRRAPRRAGRGPVGRNASGSLTAAVTATVNGPGPRARPRRSSGPKGALGPRWRFLARHRPDARDRRLPAVSPLGWRG